MRISVLVLDGVFDSGLAIVLDTFRAAAELSKARGKESVHRLETVGLRSSARTGQGLRIDLDRADPRARPDVVVVPGLGSTTPETLGRRLADDDVAEAAALLASWSKRGAVIAGACTGTFVVATSGILDGGSATTTWWLSPYFRERFPAVRLEEDRMVVASKGAVTAGAALAHVDLALWFVRRKSPAIAHDTARFLVVDERSSQAAFAMPDHLAHEDDLVRKFERWARLHLAEFDLHEAARAVGASERTLERRMRAVLGKTPLGYVQELRVETAVHKLRTTKDSLEHVAASVGYADAVTLRLLLKRKTGRSVRELRSS
jgi:transcriptional regulator GlxA family with amidase domain